MPCPLLANLTLACCPGVCVQVKEMEWQMASMSKEHTELQNKVGRGSAQAHSFKGGLRLSDY